MAFPFPIITLEDHWVSQATREFYATKGVKDPNDEQGLLGNITPLLMEFGAKRLQSMDAGAITTQVVSHAPNTIALDDAVCKQINDELHTLVAAEPERFAGFATLPMAQPDAASKELQRTVKELHFVGALIDSNCEGRFYDDSFFWPVFEVAEQLDVPIYLHPAANKHTKPLLYDGNYLPSVAETLSEYVWGWHSETAIHFLRLFAAGVFDRFPKLKIVLGHLGEMLPFQLDRIEHICARGWPQIGLKLNRSLRQVWDENVWITTSGMFYMAPLATVLKQCRPDRIMYSVDYPFGKNEDGLAYLNKLRSEGVVSDDLMQDIVYRNAERLLKLKAQAK